MLKKETLMDIKSLANQGYSHRAIARMTKTDRRTVKKYLTEGALPRYKKINKLSKLDPFKDLLDNYLEQEDYQATKVHELLMLQGFNGSYDIVQRYIQKFKEKKDRIAYLRFETIPGKQAQLDFADFQIIEPDGTKKTIYCFIMCLGYSRHKYIEFIEQCTMVNFLKCHQNAFGFFGGIPSEILYDNMKNVVIKRLVGKILWNKDFEAFAIHYGFKPLATPVYSPWVKGKVERPIGYVRERFWRGYVFNNIIQANNDIKQWLNTVAIQRIHGTTKEKVYDRFIREKPFLGALPHSPYDICEKVWRKVYKDCQFSFKGNHFVTPHQYVGKKVLLKIKNDIMRIFSDEEMIAVYKIPTGTGHLIANPKFYQKLKEDKEQLRRKYRKPFGKAKATRGLVKHGLEYEVAHRSLCVYEQVI